MLEGTKNEKIVLVILAYVIGLTTGFIGFGISNIVYLEYNDQADYEVIDDLETAGHNLVGYIPPTSNPPTDVNGSESEIAYKDGYLTIVSDDESLVLSVHTDKLGETIPDLLAEQGHHTVKPIYQLSPDGQYVYFCELHLGATDCTNLIFDKKTVTIQYLQSNQQKLFTSNALATKAFWADDGLHIGDYTSISPTTPWKLSR